MKVDFCHLPDHLASLTANTREVFKAMPAAEWGKPYPGSSSWTRSELLGHLIDSAINNQQRFVRAMIEEELRFPSYAQNEMVQVQRYKEAPIALLIDLWSNLNGHIAHLLRQIPPAKLRTRCTIGPYAEMRLEQLALDYLAHLEHHLRQLAGTDTLTLSDLSWPPADRWQPAAKT